MCTLSLCKYLLYFCRTSTGIFPFPKLSEVILSGLDSVLSLSKSQLPLVPSPRLFSPGLCECISYDKDGFVEAHCDCINGWVAVLSLGLSAEFWYRNLDGSVETLTVQSGDAVVFNGSPALNIQHGVSKVFEDTTPEFLVSQIPWLKDKRIILQIRQSLSAHPYAK